MTGYSLKSRLPYLLVLVVIFLLISAAASSKERRTDRVGKQGRAGAARPGGKCAGGESTKPQTGQSSQRPGSGDKQRAATAAENEGKAESGRKADSGTRARREGKAADSRDGSEKRGVTRKAQVAAKTDWRRITPQIRGLVTGLAARFMGRGCSTSKPRGRCRDAIRNIPMAAAEKSGQSEPAVRKWRSILYPDLAGVFVPASRDSRKEGGSLGVRLTIRF